MHRKNLLDFLAVQTLCADTNRELNPQNPIQLKSYQLLLFQDVFDLLVKAYGADPRIRDNAGKTPRQYMVASSQLQGGDMQV